MRDNCKDKELEKYFKKAGELKCPPSMKNSLYKKLELSKPGFWSLPRFAIAGISLAFVASFTMLISQHNIHQRELQIEQAQDDLQIAMHYINRVSLKSLSSVNNNGIRPALIKPISKAAVLL